MTLSDLFDRWTDLGITLWEDAGQLRYRAPRGAVTPDVVAEFRAHKSEILTHLQAISEGPQPHPAQRFEPFPLTDVQGAYLMGRSTLFDYGGVACHLYCELDYPRLDPERASAAWRALVARHDMLRVQIDAAGFQRVHRDVPPFEVTVAEPAADAPEDRAARLRQVRDRLSHAVHPTGSWPMFAVALTQPSARAGDGRTTMHISFDFLVGDWASLLRLIREWEHEYAGHPAPPTATVQFRDYVLWERQRRRSAEHRRDRDYWLDRVEKLPSAPQLPVYREHASALHNTDVRWEGQSFVLPRPQWEALARRAGGHGVTPTVAVMTCYADVLSRWAENPHFCLNLTVLDRPQELDDGAAIVGDFTSVTVLETRADNRPFQVRAREMLEQLFTDLDHHSFSGVEVMREIARTRGRDAAVMPYVFTSAIGLDPDADRKNSALRGTMGFTISQTPQAFLDCQVMDDVDGLHIHWDARQHTFPPTMLADMFAAFTDAVQALAEDEQRWQAPSPVELPAWQQHERDEANATERSLRKGLLHEFVIERAHLAPDSPAVLGRGVDVSYGELLRRASAIAAALQDHGVARGDRVAIGIPKSADQVAAVLGTLIAGAAYVPLDLRHPDARRVSICHDAQVAALLSSEGHSVDGDFQTIDVGALDSAGSGNRLPPTPSGVEQTDLAYVVYTSGSTGSPKGVELSHQAVVNTVMDVDERYGIGPDDRTFALADLGFDLSVYDLFGPLSVGAAVVLPPADSIVAPSTWLDIATEHKVTTLNTVPAVAQLIVTAVDNGATRPETVQRWILSGDRIPRDLVSDLRRVFPETRLIAMGGATEAAIWSIVHDITPEDSLDVDVPYGRPLANQQFAVLDSIGRDAPVGVPGELVITGTGLADGYSNAPLLTADSFIDDPERGRLYRTGDRGHYLPGGELAILGRTDGQVKIRGHRIELGEVENVLACHDAVQQAAVVVAGDGDQRRLHAFAVLSTPQSGEEIRQWAAEAAAEASAHVDVSDGAGLARYASALEEACAASAAVALEKVRAGLPVARAHDWVVDVWENALRHRQQGAVTESDVQKLWATAAELSPRGFDYHHFTEYVRRSAEQLPELLSGQIPAHELLFPAGSQAVAERIYQDRATMQWGNAAVTALMSQMAERRRSSAPLRVLEIGAGTGSTTANVVAGLSSMDFQYTFTDRSEFFLPAARDRWGKDARWSFATLDIDRDPTHQGFTLDSYDVVCAFGVMENARDISQSLEWMADLAVDGGMIMLSEPVGDQWWVYVSQIFLMTRPDAGSRQSFGLFPPRDWWVTQLRGHTGGTVTMLPATESALASENFAFFAAQLPSAGQSAPHRSLQRFLAERLPAVMAPQHTEFIPELPLTRNGKVDKKALTAVAEARTGGPAAERKDPTDRDTPLPQAAASLAEHLTNLWAGELALERVPADSANPFDLGANSITAAAVAGRLREEYTILGTLSFETVLRTLLTAPTIGAAAAELSQSAEPEAAAPPVEQPKVVITTTRAGAQAPRPESRMTVLFGDSLADTISTARLSSVLPEALGTMVTLTVPDDSWFTGQPSEALTGAIADRACASLLEMDADEYCLVGYSFGALVAIETARRLLEADRRVLPLGLIDPHVVPAHIDHDRLTEVMFLTASGVDLDRIVSEESDTPTLAEILDWATTRNQQPADNDQPADVAVPATSVGERVEGFLRELSALDERTRWGRYQAAVAHGRESSADADTLRRSWLRYRHTMQAAAVTPDPVVTDAVIVQPRSSHGFLPGAHERAAATWQEVLIGYVVVDRIDGDHFTMLTENFAADTANAIALAVLGVESASDLVPNRLLT